MLAFNSPLQAYITLPGRSGGAMTYNAKFDQNQSNGSGIMRLRGIKYIFV
jgi:hypothetical protein